MMGKNLHTYLTFWLLITSFSIFAKHETLDNGIVKLSINEWGTIGQGDEGINITGTDHKAFGDWLVYQNVDYLTEGIPFEMFSLKIDNDKLFANDSAGSKKGYGIWHPSRFRENNDNIVSKLTINRNRKSITAITEESQLFNIKHVYQLDDDRITINVNVENISDFSSKYIYTRGIDMDPGGTVSTIKRGGVDKEGNPIPSQDFIYSYNSEPATYPYPLTMYTQEEIPHDTYILNFEEKKLLKVDPNPNRDYKYLYCSGCLYDPVIISKFSLSSLNGIDGVIYMSFDLGNIEPNESKSFTFYYIFGKDILDVIRKLPVVSAPEMLINTINIDYKYVDYEELQDDYSITIKQIGGDKDDSLHKGSIEWDGKNLPKGVKFKFKGDENTISDSDPIINNILFNYDKEIPFTVHRNKDFRLKEKTEYSFKITDSSTNKTSEVKFFIQPISRNLTIKTSIDGPVPLLKIPLDEIKESETIKVEIFDNDKLITGEQLSDFELDILVDGLNAEATISADKMYLNLKLNPELPLCTSSIGIMPITLKIDKGFYPNDQGAKNLKVEITDVYWWNKCKVPVISIGAAIILFWYLFGLYSRDKFCRVQQISSSLMLDDEEIITGIYKFKKKMAWWRSLIPYRSDRVKIENMHFIATQTCNAVYIDKKSQSGLIIDNEEVESPGKKLIKVFNGSILQINDKEYKIK